MYNSGKHGLFDYYALGYCISHSNCKWIITLTNLNNEEEEMFVKGAANCSTLHCGKIILQEVISIDFKSVPFTSTTSPSCLLSELTKLVTVAQSDWNALAQFVKHTPKLHELVVEACVFPLGSAIQLFNSLSSLITFTSLQLRAGDTTTLQVIDESLHSEDCEALGRLLSTSKSLTHLDICGHSLTKKGIKCISNSLKLSTLFHLDVSKCAINSIGTHHIVD